MKKDKFCKCPKFFFQSKYFEPVLLPLGCKELVTKERMVISHERNK